jgi:dihydrofolate synthase/folylpolyglutamate synthase
MDESPVAHEMAALAELDALLRDLVGVKIWTAETNLRLERIEWLLAAAGHPQDGYRHVHVGGTSGKGTVAATTAAILSAHGCRVGLHLSPFVQTLNETWQIDGRNARPSQVLAEARVLRELMAAEPSPYGPPSYFEFKVALAFALFRSVGVDVAVVEVGLGGTFDATNVLGSGVKVLTNVGLDHTDILGDTVEKIAEDKVGIFRPGSRVVSAVTQPSVRNIVRDRCRELGSPLWLVDESLRLRRTGSLLVVEPDGEAPCTVAVPEDWQDYQVVSAGLAIAAARGILGADLDADLATDAIRSVTLPGRVEVFHRDGRTAVLDGAHNGDKIAASLSSIASAFGGRELTAVVAMKQGKDAASLVPLLAQTFRTLVFTTFDAPPWLCVPPEELAALVDPGSGVEVVVEPDPAQAVSRAEDIAGHEGVVVVIGSFYLVGNVRSHWVPQEVAALSGGSYGRI